MRHVIWLAVGAGALALAVPAPTEAQWSVPRLVDVLFTTASPDPTSLASDAAGATATSGITGPSAERRSRADNGSFRFDTQARDSLHTLWLASNDAHEERVACIGGIRRFGVAYITHVKPLVPSAADSLHISAETSLDKCGAPEWFGTVHTHVAKFQGLPFVTFSPDDRRVMTMWRKQWHDEGVFCVLYSQTEAHCESGAEQSDDPVYALEP